MLSMIAQHGGAKPKEIYTALCSSGSGPFIGITDKSFSELLRSLSKHDLIAQSHDTTIALGLNGERLVNHYEFYTAFTTPEEYRIADESRDLGTLPLEHPVIPGQYLIFAGRRWEVLSVDDHKKLILVRQAAAGRLPIFGGTPGGIHRAIRQEMLRLYISEEIPRYMDQQAVKLFEEGREAFNRIGLRGQRILPDGGDALLFLWEGDLVVHTVAVILAQRGIKTNVSSGVITLHNISQTGAQAALMALAQVPMDGISLASSVPNKIQEKHDCFLSEELMNIEFASRALDTESAFRVLSSHSSQP